MFIPVWVLVALAMLWLVRAIVGPNYRYMYLKTLHALRHAERDRDHYLNQLNHWSRSDD